VVGFVFKFYYTQKRGEIGAIRGFAITRLASSLKKITIPNFPI
jgi:hypothetical protein